MSKCKSPYRRSSLWLRFLRQIYIIRTLFGYTSRHALCVVRPIWHAWLLHRLSQTIIMRSAITSPSHPLAVCLSHLTGISDQIYTFNVCPQMLEGYNKDEDEDDHVARVWRLNMANMFQNTNTMNAKLSKQRLSFFSSRNPTKIISSGFPVGQCHCRRCRPTKWISLSHMCVPSCCLTLCLYTLFYGRHL